MLRVVFVQRNLAIVELLQQLLFRRSERVLRALLVHGEFGYLCAERKIELLVGDLRARANRVKRPVRLGARLFIHRVDLSFERRNALLPLDEFIDARLHHLRGLARQRADQRPHAGIHALALDHTMRLFLRDTAVFHQKLLRPPDNGFLLRRPARDGLAQAAFLDLQQHFNGTAQHSAVHRRRQQENFLVFTHGKLRRRCNQQHLCFILQIGGQFKGRHVRKLESADNHAASHRLNGADHLAAAAADVSDRYISGAEQVCRLRPVFFAFKCDYYPVHAEPTL